MNVSITGLLINWSNVNYLNKSNNRLYFTNGDWVRLTDQQVAELENAIFWMNLGLGVTQ